jgi:hypothetical protein
LQFARPRLPRNTWRRCALLLRRPSPLDGSVRSGFSRIGGHFSGFRQAPSGSFAGSCAHINRPLSRRFCRRTKANLTDIARTTNGCDVAKEDQRFLRTQHVVPKRVFARWQPTRYSRLQGIRRVVKSYGRRSDPVIITRRKSQHGALHNPDNNGTGGKFNDSIAGAHDRIAAPYQLKTKLTGFMILETRKARKDSQWRKSVT